MFIWCNMILRRYERARTLCKCQYELLPYFCCLDKVRLSSEFGVAMVWKMIVGVIVNCCRCWTSESVSWIDFAFVLV